ncbi:hypothetical protein D3C80_2152500 [compost metagenome]
MRSEYAAIRLISHSSAYSFAVNPYISLSVTTIVGSRLILAIQVKIILVSATESL